MVIDEKCKSCNSVLFRKVPLDQKGESWAVLDEDSKRHEAIWKRESDKEYYQCPHCLRKN